MRWYPTDEHLATDPPSLLELRRFRWGVAFSGTCRLPGAPGTFALVLRDETDPEFPRNLWYAFPSRDDLTEAERTVLGWGEDNLARVGASKRPTPPARPVADARPLPTT